MRFEDMITIGQVVKPQGRRGEVAVRPLTDRPDRFPTLARAYLAPGAEAREVRVTHCWPHKGRFVLKLEGIDSIDAAEALRGLELRIPPGELAALPPGSYYHHELLGLRAEDERGRALGRVAEILETGAGAPVLVVRGGEGELMLPMTEAFVLRVEPGARIVLAVPEAARA
jgi:16S rRNA processing protein RimM